MKHPVRPVYATDVDELIHELYSEESTRKMLGRPGIWRGVESQQLGLNGAASSDSLQRVLNGQGPDGAEHPAGPWRPAQVPVGWRIELHADYRHNALWALGGEEVRSLLELNHQSAVHAALTPFDDFMRRAAGYSPDMQIGMLFATFQQGANRDQEPDLRTTVVIPNGHLRKDASVMTFPEREFLRMAGQLNRLYLCEFIPRVTHSFGSVGADPAYDVPKRLFSPLAQHPVIAGSNASKGVRSFFGDDLFVQWRREAQLQGFGEDRLASVLQAARNHRVKLGRLEVLPETAHFQRAARKLWALATGVLVVESRRRSLRNEQAPNR